MPDNQKQNIVSLICFIVISFTVVGYFVGLQAPMISLPIPLQGDTATAEPARSLDDNTIPATHYAEIGDATRHRTVAWRTSLTGLKSPIEPLAEVKITPEQKMAALGIRELNRAFNGAPPTIPHPVDQISAQACLACHGKGMKTETLRIPRMSHQLLTNCTQCHVESSPRHMLATLFRENSFAGRPAPTAGPRAFHSAPPQIPHSTWMRSDCMSCHGFSGREGIRTTHPWRQNCQQCHAPSSKLDQTLLVSEPGFVSAPEIE